MNSSIPIMARYAAGGRRPFSAVPLPANGNILLLVLIAAVTGAGAHGLAATEPKIRGITGQVSDVKIAVQAGDKAAPLASSPAPRDIDLKRMAAWALNYLIESPRKHLNYDPVFNCFPYRCPPAPEGEDPIVPCDTDARMEWEWYYMRDITGSNRGQEVEVAFHRRMRSYIDGEGLVWGAPGCFNEGNPEAKYEKKDHLIHMWGAAKILKALAEDYLRSSNPESKALARKVMLAAKKLATWDDRGRCWFACGVGGFKPDRVSLAVPLATTAPLPIVGSLITYWQATGDKEGLEFAKACAEGLINNLQPNVIRFESDGSFGSGHGHITMHAVWGVAELGIVTGERKYIDFAKRCWDWMLSKGTGTGWFPAAPFRAVTSSEVCCLSDMMSNAACIARAGHPEYYDYIERYLRNQISQLQFVADSEFDVKYIQINKTAGEENVKRGLAAAKKFQGGFFNAGLNDFENELLGGAGYVWKIAGCCAPEGMRAIYTTWLNTIMPLPKSELGPSGIYVNLSFNRDSKWGRVVSFLPENGRLTVQAAVKDAFFLRPPHWAPRDQVRAFLNSASIPVEWSGAYLRFAAQPGDELTITYPLVSFKHEVGGLWSPTAPNLRLTYYWIGNMVVKAEPPAKPGTTAFFTGRVRQLPPPPGE